MLQTWYLPAIAFCFCWTLTVVVEADASMGAREGAPAPARRVASKFMLSTRASCSWAPVQVEGGKRGKQGEQDKHRERPMRDGCALAPVLQSLSNTTATVVHVSHDRGCSATAYHQHGIGVTGRVALVRRGGCAFGDKAWHAQRHGAVALLIQNDRVDEPPSPPALAPPGDASAHGIRLPVLMISSRDGDMLLSETAVRVSIWLTFDAVSTKCFDVQALGGSTNGVQSAAAAAAEAKELAQHLPCSPPALPGVARGDDHDQARNFGEERFLGYNYHYGRLNNHLVSLANALAFAQLLNRTLVYRPDPYLVCHDVLGSIGKAGVAYTKDSVPRIVHHAEFLRKWHAGGTCVHRHVGQAGELGTDEVLGMARPSNGRKLEQGQGQGQSLLGVEVVQYAFEAAVTGKKYTYHGLPELGFCDEHVTDTILLPTASTATEAAAKAALSNSARYVHLGLVYGQYPFPDQAQILLSPHDEGGGDYSNEQVGDRVSMGMGRMLSKIDLGASTAAFARAWRRGVMPARYMCAHWRQGDFVTSSHCPSGNGNSRMSATACVQTAHHAAAEIRRIASLHQPPLSTVLLATDADAAAVATVREHLNTPDGTSKGRHAIELVTFDPALCSSADCKAHAISKISDTLAEQEVCRLATTCLLNRWSTFSQVIFFHRQKRAHAIEMTVTPNVSAGDDSEEMHGLEVSLSHEVRWWQ